MIHKERQTVLCEMPMNIRKIEPS